MSCSVQAKVPAGKPVTVSVNGVPITRDAIQREMQHHPAEKPIAAWQQAAQALVIRELLLQRAAELALNPEPISDPSGRRETDEEARIRALLDREIIENQRGLGYFVAAAAKQRILEEMKREFVREELPRVFRTMRVLGMRLQDLEPYFAQSNEEQAP